MATLRKIKDKEVQTTDTYTITVERGIDMMKSINTYSTMSPETDVIGYSSLFMHVKIIGQSANGTLSKNSWNNWKTI